MKKFVTINFTKHLLTKTLNPLIKNPNFLTFPRKYSISSPNSTLNFTQTLEKPITQLIKSLKNTTQLKQFLAQVIIKDQTLDHIFLTKLIHISISSNGVTSIGTIFDYFNDLVDGYVWKLVIRACTRQKKHFYSVSVFVYMRKYGVEFDCLALPSVIKSVACLGRRKVGKTLHCCVIKMGFCLDLFVNTSIVHMYCLCEAVDDARKVFDEMPERNSVAWNALVNGYVYNRCFLEVFDVVKEMMRVKVELSEVTMVGILSSSANLGGLEHGKWVHEYIRRNGLALNVYVGTALIDMYAKCGLIEEACKGFREMKVKNVCTWNVLIAGYSMNDRSEDALMAFYSMTFDDHKPDDVTFLAVLSACYNDGLLNEGKSHFRSMKDVFRIEPKIEHYGCVVDLLGRAGLVDEALDLIRTMPFILDPAICRALLRIPKICGDSYLVELVILKLIELEPNNGDNFLLLTNLYLRQKRWAEVNIVRDMMKDRDIHEIPGYSSIEINNVIYEFIASCDFQPGLEEVYKVLTGISKELADAFAIVDTEMI